MYKYGIYCDIDIETNCMFDLNTSLISIDWLFCVSERARTRARHAILSCCIIGFVFLFISFENVRRKLQNAKAIENTQKKKCKRFDCVWCVCVCVYRKFLTRSLDLSISYIWCVEVYSLITNDSFCSHFARQKMNFLMIRIRKFDTIAFRFFFFFRFVWLLNVSNIKRRSFVDMCHTMYSRIGT